MKFEVKDMSCGGCANAITRAVTAIDPHATLEIDVATKVVKIESVTESGKIITAIEDAGFHPTLLSS
ncbi:heavy-metal-associated domain-containing protein [Paraburkholderia adhaesiva]|uniref:heavy-metal-associated domain-containing protein n=1 Tax=Paraburkholderia adhaesiva TaxID=2883244 RepID=UPI001F404534|nr:heavy-metal-associated domain-containing protein [Paraburkholderia adhaesiva]